MISITTGQTKKIEISDGLFSSNAFKNFLGQASGRAAKTHDYTCYQCGVDYFFEINSLKASAYMTGQGKELSRTTTSSFSLTLILNAIRSRASIITDIHQRCGSRCSRRSLKSSVAV